MHSDEIARPTAVDAGLETGPASLAAPAPGRTTILVVGASGFIGGRVAQALRADGRPVRCLARDPAKVADLATLGCEVAKGDISDLGSMKRALDSVHAVYVAVHTISPQPASAAGQRFMAVELDGLRNIIAGCRAQGVRRLIYVTSLGIAADSASEWLRERWGAEQLLIDSGLDATVIRPGMVVGVGGRGFGMVASQARKSVAVGLGGRQRMRGIAIDDLVYYLTGVLDDPRSYGCRYDVGNDDVLTNSEMVEAAAAVLGRRRPVTLKIPPKLLGVLAPVIERMGKLPRGAIGGLVDGLDGDASGDPTPIRAILPRPLLTFRQAAERALTQG